MILDGNMYLFKIIKSTRNDNYLCKYKTFSGTSSMVQWLRLHASTSGGTGSIPGQGSSTCCVVWPKRTKQNIDYLNINNRENARYQNLYDMTQL